MKIKIIKSEITALDELKGRVFDVFKTWKTPDDNDFYEFHIEKRRYWAASYEVEIIEKD
jgi:hypothetical protein